LNATFTPAIALEGISKTFPAQRALDDVSLTVMPGEVHALLGENGSGKSTLIRILSGYHLPDAGGTVRVGGKPLPLGTPGASHEAGLRFVHQHLAVVAEFNAVENMALDTGYTRPARIDWKAQARETERLLSELQIEMDIWRPLAECRPVERSAVAIARAINVSGGEVGTVILDEPTALLPEREVRLLFDVIHKLTDSGIAVVYVTHRLDEVFEIADRVSVLRDGRSRGTVDRADLTREGLIEMIVGRSLTDEYEATPELERRSGGPALMEVTGLCAGRISELDFRLGKGEVLGIVGINGSGREEVAKALVGAIPLEAGEVVVNQQKIDPLTPGRALAHGLVLGLSNVQTGSAVKEFTLAENISMAALSRYRVPFGPLRKRLLRSDTKRWLEDLDVRPPDPDRSYGLLSGGNQQKVILAKCLNANPSVLVLDDPTAGVDVGARLALYRLIAEQVEQGLGVIIVSNDLEDVLSNCRRVLVMRQGRLIAEVEGILDQRQLMSLAAHGADEPQPTAVGNANPALEGN
jgi:ribose transport system ATP-binding protein